MSRAPPSSDELQHRPYNHYPSAATTAAMPSQSPSPSPPGTPHNELLELSQQLTPSKTPWRIRELCLRLQSGANNASEAHGKLKRKLADISNQLSNAPLPRKRRHRHSRAAAAADEVENPTTLEERVRSAGCHHAVEYGLFLHSDFDTEKSRVQGQLRDIVALLPDDAKDITIRKHEWVAKCFDDGLSGMRSTINTRIRRESTMYIAANTMFKDLSHDPPTEISVNLADLDSSSSRINAFAHRLGYQKAIADHDTFYSPLKAEVLYKDYNGTMDPYKIFRGPALLSIFASIIRGPAGAKGLFHGESKLPSARVIERTCRIQRTAPGAIVNSSILAIWFFSGDTQLLAESDETKIDYHYLWVTFMRQICNALRDDADWVKDLFRYWDEVFFPNADKSHSEAPSANRQAVRNEINAMDAVFQAATAPRAVSPPAGSGSSQRGPSDTSPPPESSQRGASAMSPPPESSQCGPSATSPPPESSQPGPSNAGSSSQSSAGRENTSPPPRCQSRRRRLNTK
ncbi:hypothetical protein B0H17DRAFT_1190688 [Mycena rosella]|uniref:Uncharacterized protein n=1 Tax=Mycena rosella TaxID=1033263 RepID=A0AAD7H0Z1_MYCRO|nr:hypothetical protein B0H17DRAFT_1190688 [Mycena rosella]